MGPSKVLEIKAIFLSIFWLNPNTTFCGTPIRMEQGAFARQPRIARDARQIHDTSFQVQEYSSNTCVYDYISDEYNLLA